MKCNIKLIMCVLLFFVLLSIVIVLVNLSKDRDVVVTDCYDKYSHKILDIECEKTVPTLMENILANIAVITIFGIAYFGFDYIIDTQS